MHLTNSPITRILRDKVEDDSGNIYPADIIVLATGFKIGGHLENLDIKGCNGRNLNDYWSDKEAASTYKSALVSEFPNMFLLAGPNSGNGLFSVLYTVECQVDYVCKLVLILSIWQLIEDQADVEEAGKSDPCEGEC